MQNNDKYQEYFDLYNNYAKAHNLGNKYLELGKVIMHTKYYRLLYYSASSRGLTAGSSKNSKMTGIISCFMDPVVKGASG